MKTMVRCKACGYIMAEADLRDKCPACGVPSKVFEPYTDTVGENRRKILNLHLHPIIVHFPQAFGIAILLFSLGSIFLSGELHNSLVSATQITAFFLPFVVLLAALAGFLDGRARFRHISNSQILKKKIWMSIVFLVLATGLALVAWLADPTSPLFTWGIILLAAGSAGCSTMLGLWGSSIMDSALPGD